MMYVNIFLKILLKIKLIKWVIVWFRKQDDAQDYVYAVLNLQAEKIVISILMISLIML